MKNLTSMVDFVLNGKWDSGQKAFSENNFTKIINYANFIKQKLELWMFIPCDENGVIFEEPERVHFSTDFDYKAELSVFQEAKCRCLFEGVEYVQSKRDGHHSFLRITELSQINYPEFWKGYIVEDLIRYKLELTLTAQKQIGL